MSEPIDDDTLTPQTTCNYCGMSQLVTHYQHIIQRRPNETAYKAVPGQWCVNPDCEHSISWVIYPKGFETVDTRTENLPAQLPAQQPVEVPGIKVDNWPGVGQPIVKVDRKKA